METFGLMDGLTVTVVAMVVVFSVLASLWFLVELTHKLVGDPTEEKAVSVEIPNFDENRAKVAAITALVMAYEEHPAKKLEIVEVIHVK